MNDSQAIIIIGALLGLEFVDAIEAFIKYLINSDKKLFRKDVIVIESRREKEDRENSGFEMRLKKLRRASALSESVEMALRRNKRVGKLLST